MPAVVARKSQRSQTCAVMLLFIASKMNFGAGPDKASYDQEPRGRHDEGIRCRLGHQGRERGRIAFDVWRSRENTSNHRGEKIERLGREVGIESHLVPPFNEPDGAVVIGAVFVSVPGVAVPTDVVKVVVSLKNRVVLQHPVIRLRDKGLQEFGDETTVIHRRDKMTEVVQESAYDGFLIFTVSQR